MVLDWCPRRIRRNAPAALTPWIECAATTRGVQGNDQNWRDSRRLRSGCSRTWRRAVLQSAHAIHGGGAAQPSQRAVLAVAGAGGPAAAQLDELAGSGGGCGAVGAAGGGWRLFVDVRHAGLRLVRALSVHPARDALRRWGLALRLGGGSHPAAVRRRWRGYRRGVWAHSLRRLGDGLRCLRPGALDAERDGVVGGGVVWSWAAGGGSRSAGARAGGPDRHGAHRWRGLPRVGEHRQRRPRRRELQRQVPQSGALLHRRVELRRHLRAGAEAAWGLCGRRADVRALRGRLPGGRRRSLRALERRTQHRRAALRPCHLGADHR